jgi:predicted membrane GTPase involved in stress response
MVSAWNTEQAEEGHQTTVVQAIKHLTLARAINVVLIDTPPLLSVADAFVIAPPTDGLVLVVESNETSVPEVQRVLQGARTSQVKLLGVMVHKVRRGQHAPNLVWSQVQDPGLAAPRHQVDLPFSQTNPGIV